MKPTYLLLIAVALCVGCDDQDASTTSTEPEKPWEEVAQEIVASNVTQMEAQRGNPNADCKSIFFKGYGDEGFHMGKLRCTRTTQTGVPGYGDGVQVDVQQYIQHYTVTREPNSDKFTWAESTPF